MKVCILSKLCWTLPTPLQCIPKIDSLGKGIFRCYLERILGKANPLIPEYNIYNITNDWQMLICANIIYMHEALGKLRSLLVSKWGVMKFSLLPKWHPKKFRFGVWPPPLFRQNTYFHFFFIDDLPKCEKKWLVQKYLMNGKKRKLFIIKLQFYCLSYEI